MIPAEPRFADGSSPVNELRNYAAQIALELVSFPLDSREYWFTLNNIYERLYTVCRCIEQITLYGNWHTELDSAKQRARAALKAERKG
jgi:hypothetical protein